MTRIKPALTTVAILALAACSSPQAAPENTSSPVPSNAEATVATGTPSTPNSASGTQLVTATSDDLGDTSPETPDNLAQQLAEGGLVIVHRYTGATRPASPSAAPDGFIDDGQRISETSIDRMNQLGAKYRELGIPVSSALSSEYYFVYQHADQAMDTPVEINRDLTGSLYFTDQQELEESLQGLRNRTVTPPPAGTNTVLFTHQGKFDKAYGFYPDAGWTLIFAPDGSGTPRLIASLSLDEFLEL